MFSKISEYFPSLNRAGPTLSRMSSESNKEPMGLSPLAILLLVYERYYGSGSAHSANSCNSWPLYAHGMLWLAVTAVACSLVLYAN